MRTIQFGALRPAEFYLQVGKSESRIHTEGMNSATIDTYNTLLSGKGPFTDREKRPSLQDSDFQASPQLTFTLIDGKPVLATGEDALNVTRYHMRERIVGNLGHNVLPRDLANARKPTSDQVQADNPVKVILKNVENDLENAHQRASAQTSRQLVDIIG